ncbi:class I SAM-dependent methyltransferase [Candidatus Bathyarchaeota archaeon]|nr:class I SAM-dependent methyltransferase [Candidatus Bathyarchaeota archaeon]
MSLPEKEFTQEYYDNEYFADLVGKSFRRPNGTIEHWGYRNLQGEFLGAKEIADAWKTMFNPKNLLDVGCGRGTFIAYARDVNIEAQGFDYSEYAINNPYPRCKKEWLKVHDAKKPWPYKNKEFDLTVALDFWEHIYTDDLPFVMDEMFRVSKKWIFLQIAVAGSGGLQGRSDKGYAFAKDQKVPIELEGCAVAGHVTVKPEAFWYEKLERDDWMVRRDMVNWFVALVNPAIIKNWLLNSIIILSRI